MPHTNTPVIYQINTAIFLHELSSKHKTTITLANVPDKEWDAIAALHIDTVWLMGVWERSPTAQHMAHSDPNLKTALPDLAPDDIIGSAYSIYDYVVATTLGGNAGMAAARSKLKERGIRLLLDYVPNHVALDHVWTNKYTDYFLPGTNQELQQNPGAFVERPVGIIAKGKDPNFEPWSDVVQLNAFSPQLRAAVTTTLTTISDMCDGVRCDMAMLMMNEVFAKTWGQRAGSVPSEDYWASIIPVVKQHNPEFLFIAEVYWGKEPALLQQGFDLCYDKQLYDYLVEGAGKDLRVHLNQDAAYQDHLLRFIENHDEPRAAASFKSLDEHHAAAIILSTLPGARMYHEGQFEGRKVRIPVHLNRRPVEPADTTLREWYIQLLRMTKAMITPEASWHLHKVHRSLLPLLHSPTILAWQWQSSSGTYLVVVNYSAEPAVGRLKVAGKPNGTPLLATHGTTDIEAMLAGKAVTYEPWEYDIIKLG